MKPEQRRELLLHEANNPNSLYTHKCTTSAFGLDHVLNYPYFDWEVYQEPKPDIVEYTKDYGGYSYTWPSLLQANEYTTGMICIGTYKRIRCGKTGKVKSIELVKD